ncbi:MAG: cytochrome c3 family protein [Thermodesulfobacteriota bacterium]
MRRTALLSAVVLLFLGAAAAVGAATEGKLPKVIVLGAMSKTYEPVRFDHEKHVSLADGCGGCHHQHRSMQVHACKDCHRYDPASFRKNVLADRLLPCRDCHPRAENPGISGMLGLRSAYHNACNKCHWGEVGSKNLGGCTEVCHLAKAPAKQESGK